MGRMKHENVAFAQDSLTAYYGEDAEEGGVYKFVADTKMDFSSGTLYVLKLDSSISNGEPTMSTGSWVRVPNSTPSERNMTSQLAIGLGATAFDGVEDVEVNPLTGQVYFTSKNLSRTYRLSDLGTGVGDFETYVGGKSYTVDYGTGTKLEPWGSGNDNLTFDDQGNLWVLQDGGKNFIWLVREGHTQDAPRVEIFLRSPRGSEPTGMTFTPDYKFMFVSMQHPSASNNVGTEDVDGYRLVMKRECTVAIARAETWEETKIGVNEEHEKNKIKLFPSPSLGDFKLVINENVSEAVLLDVNGTEVAKPLSIKHSVEGTEIDFSYTIEGAYFVRILTNGEYITQKVTIIK